MPARSFSLVDAKVAEAEFFLCKIPTCAYDHFAAQCYFSAFVGAVRTVTFSLQSVMKPINGFDAWYAIQQDGLRKNVLAKFFQDFRTVNQHIGENAVRGGVGGANMKTRYFFCPTPDLPDVPESDAETACTEHFINVLRLIYDCYISFGPHIDPKMHYTAEHCGSLGRTIEDVELELFGLPPGFAPDGFPEAYRWQYIRDRMGSCEINHLFYKYLGKVTPEPERLPEL